MPESPRPLGPLLLVIVAVLVGMAVFWVGFMLAPAAVLLISYLALSAGERGRHQRLPSEDLAELPGAPVGTPGEGGARSARTGSQLGARRRPVTHAPQADTDESDLVEVGSGNGRSKGAQAL